MSQRFCSLRSLVVVALVGAFAGTASAWVNMETVPVGNPGNAGKWSGQSYGGYGPNRVCGSVGYAYRMGKYEVTAGQYTEFLNAVAKTDTYGLYNTDMWDDTAYGCGIQRSNTSGSYTYSVAADWANRPVNYVSWGDAARFANWMHNGQPTGPQGPSTTEDGSYYLNGANTNAALLAVSRKANATWVISSEDEWYKAAYHKNDGVTGNYWDYPTRTNSAPGRNMSESTNPGNNANYYGSPFPIDSSYYTTVVGEFQLSSSPYGTFDQGGNLWEWNEAVLYAPPNTCRGLRGGAFGYFSEHLRASYRDHGYGPTYEQDGYTAPGFRVALVPRAADFDGEGDVDLADFGHFQTCFNGPNNPPASTGCSDADFDHDNDVDLADFGVFQGCFNGPNRPPACQ